MVVTGGQGRGEVVEHEGLRSGRTGLRGVRRRRLPGEPFSRVRRRRERPAGDPVPVLALGAIGGPRGEHALPPRHGPWFPAAVLTALSVLPLVLSVLQKNHCINHGWRSPALIWRMCYSDPVVRWTSSGLAEGAGPWSARDGAFGQVAPARGLLLWLLGLPAGQAPERMQEQLYFAACTTLVVVAVGGLVAAVVSWARSDGSDPWSAAHVALSPLLVPLALVSDTLVWLALAVGGCALWRRGQPLPGAVAGALWVLAVLGMPLLVVLPVVALVARPGPLRSGLLGAGVALLVVLVPWVLMVPDGLAGLAFWDRGPGNGGLWSVVQGAGGSRPQAAVTALSLGGLLAGIGLGGVLARRATNGRELGAALGAGLLVAVACQPEVPTQAGLLAIPFIALAGLPWRTHLVWVVSEGLHFVLVWMHLGRPTNDRVGLPDDGYGAWVALRLAVWVVLVALLTLRASRGPGVR